MINAVDGEGRKWERSEGYQDEGQILVLSREIQ